MEIFKSALVYLYLSVFLAFTQFFQIVIEKDMFRRSHRRCFVTKVVLRNFAKFTGKSLCQSLFLNKVADLTPETLLKKRLRHRCFPEVGNFIKKETLAQGFFWEFCEISKNTFCYRTPPVAASVCCRRKVPAVKIEKLKAFIIKYYGITILFTKNKQYKSCNPKHAKNKL